MMARFFFLAGPDNLVKLWDFENRRCIQTFAGHENIVTSVAFGPGDQIAASGSRDKNINIWDVRSGLLIRSLKGHSDWIDYVTFGKDENILISGSEDDTIKIWDIRDGMVLKTISDHEFSYRSSSISQEKDLIVACLPDLKVLNLESGKTERKIDKACECCSFDSQNKNILFSNYSDLFLLKEQYGDRVQNFSKSPDIVNCVRFTKDGKKALSGSYYTHSVFLWDLDSGKRLHTFKNSSRAINAIHCIDLTEDGKYMISTGGDHYDINLWDLSEKNIIRSFKGHTSTVYGIQFSPDEEKFVSASLGGTVKLWKVESGKNAFYGKKRWKIYSIQR